MNKMKFNLSVTFLMVIVMLFTALAPVSADPKDTVRVWVTYREGRAAEVRNSLQSASSQFHFDFLELGAYVVTLPAAALNGILNNPHVLGVEEDAERYPISDMEAEVTAEALAVLDQSGQTVPYGIDMVQARDVWDANRDGVIDSGAPVGSTRTLCIIDTGYFQAHEDLPDAIGGYSQVDDDWSRDGYGHGSHVGGTIAAENNTLGVVGVTPGTVKLYIVKFFNDKGRATFASDLVDALHRCRLAGANVVSMSLGGAIPVSGERTAFANADAAGVLSIAAAGNKGTSAYSYPASYPAVVSVAAIDSNKNVAYFSQYNSEVELAAPGVGVLSTVPWGYESWSGTSMATPHVSAVAALVWSANPSWTNIQIRQALTATAQDLGAAGRDVYYGSGLVQAKAALDYLGGSTPPPSPPPPVTEQLVVTVSLNKSIYVNSEKVAITVTVKDENVVAVPSATISVKVTGANGTTSTLSGTTGTSGTVTLSYRINTRKTGIGTYTLDVTATKTGYEQGIASCIFVVQ